MQMNPGPYRPLYLLWVLHVGGVNEPPLARGQSVLRLLPKVLLAARMWNPCGRPPRERTAYSPGETKDKAKDQLFYTCTAAPRGSPYSTVEVLNFELSRRF
jgi:hypothetical protein